MDLNFTALDEALRRDVRTLYAGSLPPRVAEHIRFRQQLTKSEQEEWQAILAKRDWLAEHWPVDWCGAGWSAVQHDLFDIESSLSIFGGSNEIQKSIIAKMIPQL